jgi:hypothetical protein
MKQLLVFVILLSLTSCGKKKPMEVYCIAVPPSYESDSGVTPTQLANTVTEILATLRSDTVEKNFPFYSAELSISAKQSMKAAVGASAEFLAVKLEGELSKEDETSVTVSYELKGSVEAIVEINELEIPADANFNNNRLNLIEAKIPNAKKLLERLRSSNVQGRMSLVDSAKKVVENKQMKVKELYFKSEDVKNAFVNAVKAAFDEYKTMEQQFSEVCFSVEISFAITKDADVSAEVGLAGIGFNGVSVSGSIGGSKEGTHTLKLTFGNC